MATQIVLAQLVSLAALLAATAEYVQILRRRQVAREAAAVSAAVAASGLDGLVRVFLADD